jgi:hypothetical protein
MAYDVDNETDEPADNPETGVKDEAEQTASEKALVKEIQSRIKADKRHHDKAFKRMREDMYMARTGHAKTWGDVRYSVNLVGRHVKQKTAALYAKNPKAVARRRESLDFTTWDEDPKSLEMAMKMIQQAQQMMAAQAAPQVDPVSGQPLPPAVDPATGQPAAPPAPPPELEQAFKQSMAIVSDFKQGMEKRQFIQKIGKTLEILFSHSLREQKPVDFKTAMKQVVRRATTTCVGYIELGFQREMGPRPGMMEKLADYRARLDHMRVLTEKVTAEDADSEMAEIAELQAAIEALQAEPEVVIREGLIIDSPQSTRVIPDKMCTKLTGFVGARHITIEYLYTTDEVREMFGVDLGNKYKGYTKEDAKDSSRVDAIDNDESVYSATKKGGGLVCVYKHYDKVAGLMYFVVDGYPKFLRPPSAPDVFVEDFWPVYALTFNDVEDEDELFPMSDVRLMAHMQRDYNDSRQGKRDHRKAARPRWAYAKGVFEPEDVDTLKNMNPFEAAGFNLPQGTKIGDVLAAIPVPGVDPNLYDTNENFTDIQLSVGASESQFGLTGKATATGESIAAGASKSADDSSIDDLDAFLTVIARGSGQILMKEMSEEQVKAIVGVGAVWPQMTLSDIAGELYLEVEAGSTGKPNQAVEINNWKEMLPFLIQMPGISPNWLARETVRRLDDKADLTEALSADMPSIMVQNGLAQISTGDPASDPNAQGAQGGQNAPKPESRSAGSGPAFGDNKT